MYTKQMLYIHVYIYICIGHIVYFIKQIIEINLMRVYDKERTNVNSVNDVCCAM